MKTILVCNQKGGVGKSVICDEICYGLERDQVSFNLYDLDQQGSLTHEARETEDAAVSVVDTPGALQDDMTKWIDAADMIIVPTLMTRKDLAPLERMIQLLEPFEGKKSILYVLNKWDRTNMTKDFIRWFDENYPNCKTAILASTTAIPQADACGKSIVEFAPKSQGSEHVKSIYGYVKTELNIREGWR
jgi:chromosome partitioning protein